MKPKKSATVNYKAILLAFISLIILTGFPSCKDEPFEYKIDRANSLSFRLDTFDIVITDDVVFFDGFEGNSIDISLLENGIYSIQILLEDRSIVSKKITVIR